MKLNSTLKVTTHPIRQAILTEKGAKAQSPLQAVGWAYCPFHYCHYEPKTKQSCYEKEIALLLMLLAMTLP